MSQRDSITNNKIMSKKLTTNHVGTDVRFVFNVVPGVKQELN